MVQTPSSNCISDGESLVLDPGPELSTQLLPGPQTPSWDRSPISKESVLPLAPSICCPGLQYRPQTWPAPNPNPSLNSSRRISPLPHSSLSPPPTVQAEQAPALTSQTQSHGQSVKNVVGCSALQVHRKVIVCLTLGASNKKRVLVLQPVSPASLWIELAAPAPPTWKSFCFSATRFSKRFRAVELKERINAWEAWGKAVDGY